MYIIWNIYLYIHIFIIIYNIKINATGIKWDSRKKVKLEKKESWEKRTSQAIRVALGSTRISCDSSSGCQQARRGFPTSFLRFKAPRQKWHCSGKPSQCLSVYCDCHLAFMAYFKNPLATSEKGWATVKNTCTEMERKSSIPPTPGNYTKD